MFYSPQLCPARSGSPLEFGRGWSRPAFSFSGRRPASCVAPKDNMRHHIVSNTGAHFRVVAHFVEDMDAQGTGRVLWEEGPSLSDLGMEPTPPHQEFPRSRTPKGKGVASRGHTTSHSQARALPATLQQTRRTKRTRWTKRTR